MKKGIWLLADVYLWVWEKESYGIYITSHIYFVLFFRAEVERINLKLHSATIANLSSVHAKPPFCFNFHLHL